MASLEELRSIRLKKLEILKEAGIDPFPAKVPRTFCLADAKNNFIEYEKSQKEVSLCGRIMAIRGQGAIQFFVLDDGKANFQAVVKKDVLNDKLFSLLNQTIDIGDIISFTGTFFTTQRGEQSLLVNNWTIATKALLPLPEKWHGLVDPDEKLRKRYLDFVMDKEARDIFYKKAHFWKVVREFLEGEGFLEVETPTLEVTTGGAEATPFKTYHNDFDLNVYLRISVGELWQKRLMAGGFPKTFEIGRVYRNEGTSMEHLQEFTNMEFYWSYADYNDGMQLVQKMYRKIAEEVFGTTKFTYKEHTFDLSDEWKNIDYKQEIKKQTNIDIDLASDDDIKDRLDELKISYEGANRERLVDTLWKYCRKNIAGPAFLINHPKLVAPLAKSLNGTQSVQMFQPIIGGSEMGRGYSELNDPIDQFTRFEEQQALRDEGSDEAQWMDNKFISALEHGMPPTSGVGIGIDRLVAFLTDSPTLKEVILFPTLRPVTSEPVSPSSTS